MDGIIIINKPKGITSHDVIYKVRKKLNIKKVGHTGTLDPNATGVLPILIGKGTKLSQYLTNHDKIYEAVLKLGEKRSTGDVEGEVTEVKSVNVNQNIREVLTTFIGKQTQIPPMHSAIKINGKKLYEYARKGITIEVPPKEIEIYSIELLNINEEEKEIIFKVHCGKGTYIRTLCEDIAEKLGTVGYMKDLCRIKVGNFDIKDSITIEDLDNEEIVLKNLIKEDIFK